eukprot:GHVT01025023.1.p1 GENE.GHVT01025023.1~~GHVT01025023.1.p1  ORF type:complete len:351 (+),score=19.82 GHVT01025023.1:3487-4539(+)
MATVLCVRAVCPVTVWGGLHAYILVVALWLACVIYVPCDALETPSEKSVITSMTDVYSLAGTLPDAFAINCLCSSSVRTVPGSRSLIRLLQPCGKSLRSGTPCDGEDGKPSCISCCRSRLTKDFIEHWSKHGYALPGDDPTTITVRAHPATAVLEPHCVGPNAHLLVSDYLFHGKMNALIQQVFFADCSPPRSDGLEGVQGYAMKEVDVPADGNCLFSSVAHQLWGDASRQMDVRMMSIAAAFDPNFPTGIVDMKVGIGNNWGSNLEVEPIMHRYDGVFFFLDTQHNNLWPIFGQFNPAKRLSVNSPVYFIIRRGLHFRSRVPRDKPNTRFTVAHLMEILQDRKYKNVNL